VYLLTNYGNDQSDQLFALSVQKLGSCLNKVKRIGLPCIIAGDFNWDLSEIGIQQSARTSMIMSMLGDYFSVLAKDSDFTYVHNSARTSNLDHIAVSHNVSAELVKVISDYQLSDHLPITSSLQLHGFKEQTNYIIPPRLKTHRDWARINSDLYASCTGFILSKIRAPLHLLQRFTKLPKYGFRLCLNMYVAEISHALCFAKNQSVPLWKIRKGIIPGWSSNPDLVTSCLVAKFWFNVWKDCNRPLTGAVNLVRLFTKRNFSKALTLYGRNLLNAILARAKHDKSLL
jgi:hypothetical protein